MVVHKITVSSQDVIFILFGIQFNKRTHSGLHGDLLNHQHGGQIISNFKLFHKIFIIYTNFLCWVIQIAIEKYL